MADAHRIANPWTPFGLSDDPFFQAALDPGEDDRAIHPIHLFVGRTEQLQLIGSQVIGSSSSRALITGAPGVGKTSLINRIKASLAAQGVLTHAAPVRVMAGMTPRHFEAEVLRVLLQIQAADAAAETSGPAPRHAPSADDRARDGQFWRRIGRLIVGEDSVAGGLSLGGFGAQAEAVRIPAEVRETSLTTEVAEAFRRLSRHGARRVLLHINNLENLTAHDARSAAVLMQQVRDTLLCDYAHWVFVGATGVEQSVFGATPQVESIVPLTVPLPPLPPEQVEQLLTRRYAHLRSGIRFTPPVEPAVAGLLYARFRGDLRGFLNLLARTVLQHAVSAPGETVGAAEILALATPRYRTEVVPALISADDFAHLQRVTGGHRWDHAFRVADFVASAPRFTQSSASKLVARLVASGVIAMSRREGRSTYYHVANGRVSVALGHTV